MATRSLGVLTIDVIAKTGNFASGMDKAERASKKAADSISRSTGTATGRVRELGTQSQKTAQDVSELGSAFTKIAAPIAAFLGTQQIAQSADQWTNINNRLKLVTDSSADLAIAQENVFRIAQEARAPLSETAELYQRIATNAEELKLNADGVAEIVETISKTLAISGANAESAQAALWQLGQAFASGVLRGEEFNSVMEQTPALAKAIADGMGVTIGKLRELANDGKLTTDVVIKALQKQGEEIDKSFGKLAPTISGALTTANNSFVKLIGTMDQSLGVSSGVANALINVAGAMDSLGENSEVVEKAFTAIIAVAGGKAAASLVAMIKQMQASAVATKAAAGAASQKALVDEKSALSSLAAVKAEQQRAVAAVAAVNAENSAAKARAALEVNRLKSVQSALAAELELEQVRHKAQITDIGRQKSIARMAELRLSEVAIIKQLQVAETSLAATTTAANAKAIAALEARRIATINVATAEAAATAATATRATAMTASATAATLSAAALAKVAAAGRGLLGILGGPVGLIVTLGIAAASFIDFGESAEDGFDKATAAATKADERVKNLSKSILANDLKINVDTASFDSIGKAIDETTKKLEEAEKQYERMQDIFNSDVPQIGPNQVTQESIDATKEKIEALTSALGKLQKAQSGTRFSGVAEAEKFLESLVKQNQQLKSLSEKEEAISFIKEKKLDQDSEIAKKILEQAAANDALRNSQEVTKKQDSEKIKNIKQLSNEYKTYLEGLEEQLRKTGDMTVSEKLLYDIQKGRLSALTPGQRESLELLAREIDAKEKLNKLEEQNRSINAFAQNAQAETQSAKDAYALQLATVALGEREAIQVRERIALEQEFNKKKSDLLAQMNSGEIDDRVYKEETRILDEELKTRMDMQSEYFEHLNQAQGEWLNGAKAALADYADAAEKISGQAYDLINGALEEMTTGFADAAAKSILWAEDFDSAMKGVARSILENVLGALIELGARYAVNAALEVAGVQTVATAKSAAAAQVAAAQVGAIGATTAAATTATATTVGVQTAAAAETTAAWTPAATAASIGSFGSAAAIGLAAVIAAIALAKGGFKTGGYTGNGGTSEVAGMVHGQEFVFDAASTKRIGVGNLEKLRTGRDTMKATPAASGGVSRSSTVNQVFNVSTPDADSFRMSQRQIMKRAKRSIG